MATEIYNNLHPRKTSHIDERLITVANVAALPTLPTLLTPGTNFLYEGAVVYVTDVALNYQAQEDGITAGTLVWVNIGGASTTAKVQGTINLLPNTNILDMNLVSPAIALCHSVLVSIVGGNSATITSVSNLPVVTDEDDLITIYIETGKTLTFNHTDYDAAGTDDIILEDGFDMTITGRLMGNESLTLKKHDAANAQWDATQFLKKGDLTTSFLNLFTVENSLNSTSTTKALSAFQGKVLDDKITLKQDALTPGDHISITGTSPNVTIAALPWAWEKVFVVFPEGTYVVSTFLVGAVTGLSDKYRWVDLKTDGTWMIPPYQDPSVYAHWFEINKPTSNTTAVKYNLVSDTSFTEVGSDYNPRMSTTAVTGSSLGLIWNSDGPASEKVSFVLPEGEYKVKAKININSDRHNDLRFNMYTTNGITTAAIGVPGTNTLNDVAFVSSPTTAWTNTDDDSYVVESLITVGSTAGIGDGIIFGLTSTSGLANTASSSAAAGWVEITKIK